MHPERLAERREASCTKIYVGRPLARDAMKDFREDTARSVGLNLTHTKKRGQLLRFSQRHISTYNSAKISRIYRGVPWCPVFWR